MLALVVGVFVALMGAIVYRAVGAVRPADGAYTYHEGGASVDANGVLRDARTGRQIYVRDQSGPLSGQAALDRLRNES